MLDGLNKIDRAADRIETAIFTIGELIACVFIIGAGIATIAGTIAVMHFMAPGRPLRSLPADGLWAVIIFVFVGLCLIWQGFRGLIFNLMPKPKGSDPTNSGRR